MCNCYVMLGRKSSGLDFCIKESAVLFYPLNASPFLFLFSSPLTRPEFILGGSSCSGSDAVKNGLSSKNFVEGSNGAKAFLPFLEIA